MERAEAKHQLVGDLDGGPALGAGAQQDGDQLGVPQRLRPQFGQPFAGPFIFGQVLDADAIGHCAYL